MSDTTLITQADIALANKIGVPAAILPHLMPPQRGWLQLAKDKADTFKALTDNELVVQAFLLDITKQTDLVKVQEAIKSAKASMETGKAQRMWLTNMIDERIKAPAMEYEKRNALAIEVASTYEFELRKKVATDQDKNKSIAEAKTSFATQIKNEYFRIAAEYKDHLERRIVFYYTTELSRKSVFDPQWIDDIKMELGEIPVPKMSLNLSPLVTREDGKVIFDSIPKYDPRSALLKAQEKVDETFSMYEHDLQNAAIAAKRAQEEADQQSAQLHENLEMQQATNNLVAQAESVEIVKTVTIKKRQEIVTEETEAFGLAIISNFVTNWAEVKRFIKVKAWGNLKVSQMQEALNKYINGSDFKPIGLTLKTVEK